MEPVRTALSLMSILVPAKAQVLRLAIVRQKAAAIQATARCLPFPTSPVTRRLPGTIAIATLLAVTRRLQGTIVIAAIQAVIRPLPVTAAIHA